MTDAEKPARSTRRRLKWPAVGAALILLVLVALSLARSGADKQRQPLAAAATFRVERGPLDISVVQSGTIQSLDQVIIKNEVEGRTTILFLVREGTRVKKGDLLIELEASRLQDERVDQQIRVMNAEAAFIRARENLEVVRNQARSEEEKAELDARFAAEDLRKYLEGDHPKNLKEAEAQITIRQEELRRAQEKLQWSRVLFDEKYISQTELQADELAAQRAQLDLDLALTELALLKNFTHGRKLDELRSQEHQTAMALERTRRKAAADVLQAEVDLRARESEFQREQGKLEKIEQQIGKTRIYAPSDGLVVYATSTQANFRGNIEPLAEGQEVRERQELIYLPAPGSVKAEVKIHESNLDKVSVGLPVRITVNALPGRVFTGRVANIAPLPDAVSVWLNPDLKVYNTDIHLEGDVEGLRTGMSCRAEILVAQYADALYVPVQAVTRVDGHPTVFVRQGGQFGPRQVEVGLDNNRMVHVLQGLEVGELVLLTPPLQHPAEPAGRGEVRPPVAAGGGGRG
ncbi:efflux RND transporter periplasmic adaptor subunit [Geoalkalibacter sp.]|uniref:efflux RND transporter periplasmic adaptor subunit n=1 Tax=Geoalkalibacter sp. TaxID=3041440 RepID=UPI00272DC9F9|nr:efflux RND transporter periplasmic adaptor subunit [Geoalkalibacter sp.]